MSPFARIVMITLLLSGTAVFAMAQTAHDRIRNAMGSDDPSAALQELNALESKEPEIFFINNYDYLAARLAERAGDHAEAIRRFELVAARDTPLAQYALLRMASVARSSGNLFLERLYLTELSVKYPDGLPARSSERRAAVSAAESGDHSLTVAQISNGPLLGDRLASANPLREELVLLAKAFERSGNVEYAREFYERLLARAPDPSQPDDASLEAVRGLDRLGGDISPQERFRRAGVYQFNRDFAAARAHCIEIVDGNLDEEIVPECIYLIGRGYAQLGNYSDAVLWFERAWEQYPNLELAKDVLLQTGSAYSRIGKYREAVTRYRIYIDRYPDDERVDRAYFNIADISRDLGVESEALRQTAIAAEKFKGKVGEAQAVFADARIYISLEDWKAALSATERLLTLNQLGGTTVPGGTTRSEAQFIHAFVLEQMRNFDSAIHAYLAIPDGRDEYYGRMANERLAAMAQNAESGEAIAAKITSLQPKIASGSLDDRRKAIRDVLRMTADPEIRERLLSSLARVYNAIPEYRDIPSYKFEIEIRDPLTDADQPSRADTGRSVAGELAFLGLYDEAAPELEASNVSGTVSEYTIAEAYRRGGYPHRAIAFAEARWRQVPRDYQVELIPDEAVKMLYPAGFPTSARRYADAIGIDPRFLMAIARQESRFRPEVRSAASARGMMQFIPSTAAKTAAELSIEDFIQDDLYDPDTALRFAAQYISGLYKIFPNLDEAVAASYNGGEDNVNRWIKRSKSTTPERYVPEIAFAQTKDYTYKVMSNYYNYTILYNEELRPR